MKIAVTAREPLPTAPVDERFGRAYWLLVYDPWTGAWDTIDNAEARNAVQGAGIKAAQNIADQGVDILLTGVTGPKAFHALEAAGIEVFHGASGTVESAVSNWSEGRLERASSDTAIGRP